MILSIVKWSVLLLGLLAVVAALGCPEVPESGLLHAKVQLEKAKKAGALRYAPKDYRTAQKLMESGQLEMARQKGRLAPLRDFKKADSLLALAVVSANKAETNSKQRRSALKQESHTELEFLTKEMSAWREALDGNLDIFHAERHWTEAGLALQTGNRLIDAGEYEEAIKSIHSGRKSLDRVSELLAEYANDEAQKIEVWRRWVSETIGLSKKQGTYVVIVDKSAHKLFLLQRGTVTRTFDCDIGYNSARQKFVSGDGSTPEGQYKITAVRHRGSKYYKALNLNYPSENDKRRFAQNKARGIISKNARIGGLIEIHGEGGQKRDWTDGCVALSNEDMDNLMKYVTVDTPVTIVRRSDLKP